MIDAPTDGTRVLIKAEVIGFVPERHGSHFRVHKPIGTRWVECHFKGGRWQEWAGTANRESPKEITPLAWAPLPEEKQE